MSPNTQSLHVLNSPQTESFHITKIQKNGMSQNTESLQMLKVSKIISLPKQMETAYTEIL